MEFIHIDINRTGSSALRAALNIDNRSTKHTPAHEVVREDGWRDAYIFSVVRNPYRRILSQWKHRRQWTQDTFTEWLERVYVRGEPVDHPEFEYWPYLFWPQVRWLTLSGPPATPIADDVFKLEQIDSWWPRLQAKIDQAGEIEQRGVSFDRTPPSEAYTDRGREIVVQAFGRDFQTFGYNPNRLPESP